MIYSLAIALAVLAPFAAAENRVFGDIGSTKCQACLKGVEATCDGPVSSDQFNECFCDVHGDTWSTLEDCVSGDDCLEDAYNVLLTGYGSHCFAYNEKEEEEVCVDASQDNELLLSLADAFCTEFITLSSSTSATSTTSSAAASATASTTSDASSVTSTSTVPSTTSSATSTASTEASSSNTTTSMSSETTTLVTSTTVATTTDSAAAAETDDADDTGVSLSSLGVTGAGLVAMAVSGIIMQFL